MKVEMKASVWCQELRQELYANFQYDLPEYVVKTLDKEGCIKKEEVIKVIEESEDSAPKKRKKGGK